MRNKRLYVGITINTISGTPEGRYFISQHNKTKA